MLFLNVLKYLYFIRKVCKFDGATFLQWMILKHKLIHCIFCFYSNCGRKSIGIMSHRTKKTLWQSDMNMQYLYNPIDYLRYCTSSRWHLMLLLFDEKKSMKNKVKVTLFSIIWCSYISWKEVKRREICVGRLFPRRFNDARR